MTDRLDRVKAAALKTARDCLYSIYWIKKIEAAKSEHEISRILKEARLSSCSKEDVSDIKYEEI